MNILIDTVSPVNNYISYNKFEFYRYTCNFYTTIFP